MKTKMLMLILICILNTNTYSWDEVQYFDNKPNQNVINSSKDKEYDRRDSRDSDYSDRRYKKDYNDYKDRRNSDYNDYSDYKDRRNSDYNDYSDYKDRKNSNYNDYSDYKDRRNSDYNDYSDYKDRRDRDSDYKDRRDRDSDYKDRRDRDSDYNNHYDNDRRDRDYRQYDDRRDRDYNNYYDRRDRDHDRREKDKEKIIWEEVSKEDSINGYKAFLKTFPNSYYANLAKYKIEKLTTYGEIDAKALEAYKNIPYWVTNGELEDKLEQCAVASIDLDREDQIKSLREVEKQAKDKLSSNYYLLSTDIIKTNFYILDKKIYALAYVYNNKKAERNKKMFYK